MTCDGRGRPLCPSCGGSGRRIYGERPNAVAWQCLACKGKGRTAGRCVGCDACSAKDAGEAKKQDTQGSLFTS